MSKRKSLIFIFVAFLSAIILFILFVPVGTIVSGPCYIFLESANKTPELSAGNVMSSEEKGLRYTLRIQEDLQVPSVLMCELTVGPEGPLIQHWLYGEEELQREKWEMARKSIENRIESHDGVKINKIIWSSSTGMRGGDPNGAIYGHYLNCLKSERQEPFTAAQHYHLAADCFRKSGEKRYALQCSEKSIEIFKDLGKDYANYLDSAIQLHGLISGQE